MPKSMHPFAGNTFFANIFVLLESPWYVGLETQVAVIPYVNSAPIAARDTFSGMWTFLNAAAFPWQRYLYESLTESVPIGTFCTLLCKGDDLPY